MNAYELADAIEDWDSDGQWDTPAANMLRQQADRIAELEKLVHQRFDDGKRLGIIETEDRFNRFLQTKPLSDEEIEEIAKPFLENMENDSWYGEQMGIPDDGYAIIEFAKAILKKASEK